MFNLKTLIALTVFSLPSIALYADETPSSANKIDKSDSMMQHGGEQSMNMQAHMAMMQALHEKMMNAKTPEEKQELMKEGKQMMDQCMSMMNMMKMNNMGSGDMAKRQEMMEKRMDMMQMMMQTMMDSSEMKSAPTKEKK
ncbi:MAG: type IV secretion protein Dot [Candidatus Berkiellales bacterium]